MTSQYLFITGSDTQSIIERLNTQKHDERFRELYISMIDIDTQLANAIIEVICDDETRTWDGIHIAKCTGNVHRIIQSALEHGKIKQLSLLPSGHQLDEQSLSALSNGMKKNQSVKSLVFRVDLFERLSQALAEGLASATTTTLEELSLVLSTSDSNVINTLAKGIQQNVGLKTLLLNRCSLEDGQVASFIKSIENHPSLKVLSIQGNSCRAMGMVSLSGMLSQQSNSSSHPNHNKDETSDHAPNSKSSSAFSSSSSSLSILKRLDLSKQNFDQDEKTFGSISFLAPALSENKSMTFLDLSHNSLSDLDVTYLASALIDNTTLHELKLINCSISNKGAKIFARQLHKMIGLRRLWLQDNPFGLKGIKSLHHATLQNHTLEQIWFPTKTNNKKGNAIINQLQESLFPHLQLNQAGQRLLHVDSNTIPRTLWPLALGRIKDMTFHFSIIPTSSSSTTTEPKKTTILETEAEIRCNVVYTLLHGSAVCVGR